MLRSLGHALLGAMFIFGGAGTLSKPEPRAALVEKTGLVGGTEQAKQATVANGAVMLIAGTALALDLMPKFAATLLIGSLLPTTLVGHPYWQEQDPAGRANQQIQFMKNLSMLGGLLLVLAEKE